MNNPVPTVAIGLPVYNGEKTLKAALDSLLAQSFIDTEIIISDNASTDGTAAICKDYAARDQRIRYIRQDSNLGAAANFKFVLDEARSPYFMWAACDDIRSPDFVETNVKFLGANSDYVASTSPNCFEGQDPQSPDLVTFALEGSIEDRFDAFLNDCWVSHGIFYAVIRRDVLLDCTEVGKHYLGLDWAIILFMASRGSIHRANVGLMTSGVAGISNSASAWRAFRTNPICWVIPFYRVSYGAIMLSLAFPVRRRIKLIHRLLKLNVYAVYNQIYAEFYPYYREHVRPWRQRLRGRRD